MGATKSWGATQAPKTGGGNVNRADWRELGNNVQWRIRLFGGVLPNMIYWVKTRDGNRTRSICNFNRETEQFDSSIDDPIGKYVSPRDEKCRPQFNYVTKCIFRNPGARPDEVKVLELKQTVYNAIADLAKNPDWGDPTDDENGYDLVIEKKKTGPLPQNVKYIVTPSRKNSPITPEERKMIEADGTNLAKLYKQDTPPEQMAWLKENTDYLSMGGVGVADTEGFNFDPNEDVPF